MKTYKCSSCDFKATGPSGLGKHYKDTGHKRKQYQPKSQPTQQNRVESLEDLIIRREQLTQELKRLSEQIESRIEAMGLSWKHEDSPLTFGRTA